MALIAVLVIVGLLCTMWGGRAGKEQDKALETKDASSFFGNGCISLLLGLVALVAFYGAIGSLLTTHPEMFLPR